MLLKELLQIIGWETFYIANADAFAALEQGMEGFIPRSELPTWVNPLRILELDPFRRRLKLSLRQAEPGTE